MAAVQSLIENTMPKGPIITSFTATPAIKVYDLEDLFCDLESGEQHQQGQLRPWSGPEHLSQVLLIGMAR
jgi:hypothetical protein